MEYRRIDNGEMNDDRSQSIADNSRFRMMFDQFTPLIDLINKHHGRIENEDLDVYMHKHVRPDCLIQFIDEYVAANPIDSKQALWNLYYATLWKDYFKLAMAITILTFMGLGQIILLQMTTKCLMDFNRPTSSREKILLLIIGMIILHMLNTYIDAVRIYLSNLAECRITVTTQYLLYLKCLKRKVINEDVQSHQQEVEGEALPDFNTLLTVDTQTLTPFIACVVQSILCIFTILIACLLLYLLVGNSVWLGITILFCSTLINFIMVYFYAAFITKQLISKDQRLALSADVINCMKSIKYLGWESLFEQKIMDKRKVLDLKDIVQKEFKMLLIYRVLDGLLGLYWGSVSYLLLFFFVIDYISDGNSLQETNIFAIIAIIDFIRYPIGLLPEWLAQIQQAKISYARIERYLLSDEIDTRITLTNDKNITESIAMQFNQSDYEWPSLSQGTQLPKQFNLKVPSMFIKKQSLNLIIGKVGSGKTAFLHMILNELSLSRPQAEISIETLPLNVINGKLAFVDQNPWVRNTSLKENVVFGGTNDDQLFDECVRLSCLDADIEEFSEREFKSLGPAGRCVSGGQRQRVTLARAIYHQADIYLFDDIFSSLDIHVADQIFQNIVSYLFKSGKTIILVTSHYRQLSTVDANIILLVEGDIITDEKNIQEYLQTQEQDQIQEELEENKEPEIGQVAPQPQRDGCYMQTSSSVDEEHREEGEINSETLQEYILLMTIPAVIFYLVFITLAQGFRFLTHFWLIGQLDGDPFYDSFNAIFENDLRRTFIFLLIAIAVNTAIYMACYVFGTLISGWRIFKMLNLSILNARMTFFDCNSSGRIINRLSNDMYSVDDQIPVNGAVFGDVFSRCIGVPMMIMYSSIAAAIVILMSIVSYFLVGTFRKSNRDIKRINSVNEGRLLSLASETAYGVITIRAFGKQLMFLRDYTSKASDAISSTYASNSCFYWIGMRLRMLANSLLLAILLTIMFVVIFDWKISYVQLALALTYSLMVNEEFVLALRFFNVTERSLVSVERIYQYLKVEQENRDRLSSKVYQKQQSENQIEFLSVSMSYDGKCQALNKFTLSIKRGEKIAICGRTGSGKSSIINLLFRLYDHQEGAVYIDGVCTTAMSLKELRSKISIVPQFGFLFNASVRENLDPDLSMNEQDLLGIFEKHELSIRNLSGKDLLDFTIDQGGENLSNGEKQIINCVRVLLQQRDIICLDEATSNMDPKTDKKIHEILFQYSANKTLIVITHRLENIEVYDRVVVMDQGRIVEIGHVSELRQNQNGFFNKIAKQI